MAVMFTVTELAEVYGLSKAAISQRVKRLIKQHGDDWIERDVQGRITGIEGAKFEELTGLIGDNAKRPDASKPQDEPGGTIVNTESLDEARRKRAWIEFEKSQLDLAEACGMLVRKDRLEEAGELVGGDLARIFDRLVSYEEDLVLALEEGSRRGLRNKLKEIARALRQEAAQRLLALVEEAPETDSGENLTERLAAQ